MRMTDRRPSKNVNDVSNVKLTNMLTEKYMKRGCSSGADLTVGRKVALCI